MVYREEILSILKAKKSGSKGWYLGDCPYCGKEKHLGIIFGNISSFVCKKCNTHGTITKLLYHIGRNDLVSKKKVLDFDKTLNRKLFLEKEEFKFAKLQSPNCYPPLGFKRIFSDSYLENRGFSKEIFHNWEIGVSNLLSEYKNYIFFLIKENDEVKGWVGRFRANKKFIDSFNKENKSKGKFILRWRNSESQFDSLLFGLDEITEETTNVILVEGITSKANIDYLLNLYNREDVKCVCSFGKKITDNQIYKLLSKRIENILLIYDNDATKEAKEYSLILEKYFNVEIGFIYMKDKDPGDLNLEECLEIVSNPLKPIEFYTNFLNTKKLKI